MLEQLLEASVAESSSSSNAVRVGGRVFLVDEPYAGMREGSVRHKRAKSRANRSPSEKPLHSGTVEDKDFKSTINLCDDEGDLRDTILRVQHHSSDSARSQEVLWKIF